MPAIEGCTRNHVGENPIQNLCTSCTLDLVRLELHLIFKYTNPARPTACSGG